MAALPDRDLVAVVNLIRMLRPTWWTATLVDLSRDRSLAARAAMQKLASASTSARRARPPWIRARYPPLRPGGLGSHRRFPAAPAPLRPACPTLPAASMRNAWLRPSDGQLEAGQRQMRDQTFDEDRSSGVLMGRSGDGGPGACLVPALGGREPIAVGPPISRAVPART
jgi:hypothetical protein